MKSTLGGRRKGEGGIGKGEGEWAAYKQKVLLGSQAFDSIRESDGSERIGFTLQHEIYNNAEYWNKWLEPFVNIFHLEAHEQKSCVTEFEVICRQLIN